MAKFVITNPSRQHATVFHRLDVRERLFETVIPMEGTAEITVPDKDKKSVAEQLDMQCRGLALKMREK